MEQVFSDKSREAAENGVVALFRHIGEDETRAGLQGTPARVVRAWEELTAGYRQDPAKILSTTFDEPSENLIVVKGIRFRSTCEHHLLGFEGEAIVAYLPTPGKVVGLSKVARLVECFTKRLQIQERIGIQIADAIERHLDARAVGVVLKAHHSCMGCRGVRQPGAEMVTMCFRGEMKEGSKAEELKAEFWRVTVL